MGITKVFLVYGGGSVIRSGLLDEIKKSLDEEHISYEELGGVKPNPRLSFARKGVEKAIAFGAELILAVGGGSAIDTAKGIAIGAANPGTDIWEFWKNKKELKMICGVLIFFCSDLHMDRTEYRSADQDTSRKKAGSR
mgnify:CR=1 FL=1